MIQKITGITFVTAFILLIPLVAMQFSDEVVWTRHDFIAAGTLLFSTGLIYVLATRNVINIKRRIAVGIVVMAVFLYIWAELAVGIFTNWGS